MKKRLLIDSNIIIFMVKNSKFRLFMETHYPLSQYHFLGCFANEVEPRSMALRRKWGSNKGTYLENIFSDIEFINEVNSEIKDAYVEMEAYSMGQHPERKLPQGVSAKRIGQNDLWIAATAYTENAALLTMDADFLILQNEFIEVLFIDVEDFKN